MIETVDYDFLIPDYDPEMIHLRILTGVYEGVVFNFDKVSFEEENEKTYLQFTHDVVEYNNHDDLDEMDFKNFIGNILISILAKNIDQEIVDESRTSNTEEPNT